VVPTFGAASYKNEEGLKMDGKKAWTISLFEHLHKDKCLIEQAYPGCGNHAGAKAWRKHAETTVLSAWP
jgi:hypothetical protein